jgi:hypothetical protein
MSVDLVDIALEDAEPLRCNGLVSGAAQGHKLRAALGELCQDGCIEAIVDEYADRWKASASEAVALSRVAARNTSSCLNEPLASSNEFWSYLWVLKKAARMRIPSLGIDVRN